MNISAIIVTRGDVDLEPVLDSIPEQWDVVVWNNNSTPDRAGHPPRWWRWPASTHRHYPYGHGEEAVDCSVYGRYAAIEHAHGDVIYVQDDDVIVSDPAAIVDAYLGYEPPEYGNDPRIAVACNMPEEFRHAFYRHHALVGFGAAFHRDAPERAFTRFALSSHRAGVAALEGDRDFFDRTADIVFTALTPRVLVDVPKTNRKCAYADNRMWMQPNHMIERTRMLQLVSEAISGR